jgi:CRISPR/Cas system CSM-associated protein Csm3 (group 7 of RAMP superfamily)
MTYDFYAGIWNQQELERKFFHSFSNEWNRKRDNRGINWPDKVKKFRESLEDDINLYEKIIDGYLKQNSSKYGTFYQKLLTVLGEFISCNENRLKEEIHRILRDNTLGIRNYDKRHKREIDKLNLLENPKNAYKGLFMEIDLPRDLFVLMNSLSLEIPNLDSRILPRYFFFLHVKFTLQKPYISKDDEEFYIHDNPVSKERVFKVPYIRASSWKGNLRWASVEANNIPEDDGRIMRIFGNKKGEKSQKRLRKGRLHTYPTFFNRIGLDIINPHDRETRTGKNPITLEVVPKDTKGDLYLLYIPFDKIGESEDEIANEIEEDLLIICNAAKALLTEYGMSAKRTSGYGAAAIGRIEFRSELLKKYERYTDLDGLINELNNKNRKRTYAPHGGRI